MADKMATREAYGNTLKELGAKYPNLVVMDADLSGSTKTSVFAKEYPETRRKIFYWFLERRKTTWN